MLEAVRYITSRREYDEMMENPNLRNAIDGFWISRGGNAEKSRLLIRHYYNRVQEANTLFTSFVEGWRTDRGMIYIVFGIPNTVYRNSSTETWIYGTPNSTLALNFLFTRVNNPFSDNDLVLSRSPIYESNWYRAVETWRQGRAYNSIY
jgi:GWxTD domain-containing protein